MRYIHLSRKKEHSKDPTNDELIKTIDLKSLTEIYITATICPIRLPAEPN